MCCLCYEQKSANRNKQHHLRSSRLMKLAIWCTVKRSKTALVERRLGWHLVVRYKPNDLSSQWCNIEWRTSEHWLARLSQHRQLWLPASLEWITMGLFKAGSVRNPTTNLSGIELHRKVHRKLWSHRYSCRATFSAQSTWTESVCTCPFAVDTLHWHWLCLHLRGFNRFFSTLLARRFLLSPEKSRSFRIQRLMNFSGPPRPPEKQVGGRKVKLTTALKTRKPRQEWNHSSAWMSSSHTQTHTHTPSG